MRDFCFLEFRSVRLLLSALHAPGQREDCEEQCDSRLSVPHLLCCFFKRKVPRRPWNSSIFRFLSFRFVIRGVCGPYLTKAEPEYVVDYSFGFLIFIDSTLKLYFISENISKFSFALLSNHKFSYSLTRTDIL